MTLIRMVNRARQLLLLPAMLLLLVSLAACSYRANDQPAADRLVEGLHQAIRNHDYRALPGFYDKSFFKIHDEKEWLAYWAGLEPRLGKLQSIHRIYAQKDARYRGDYYVYGYMLAFTRGKVRETISIFKGIESKKLSVVGHVAELE